MRKEKFLTEIMIDLLLPDEDEVSPARQQGGNKPIFSFCPWPRPVLMP